MLNVNMNFCYDCLIASQGFIITPLLKKELAEAIIKSGTATSMEAGRSLATINSHKFLNQRSSHEGLFYFP